MANMSLGGGVRINGKPASKLFRVVTYRQRDGRDAKTTVTPAEYAALRKARRTVREHGGWK